MKLPYKFARILHFETPEAGFTLIELVVVMMIIGALAALTFGTPDSFSYWKNEGFIRKLSETLTFLHRQAMIDRAFYRIEFDLDKNTYIIGVMKPEDRDEELVKFGSDIGTLALELAAFTNPSMGSAQTFIPPPSIPSLGNRVDFPERVKIMDIRTMRGKKETGKAYILFSPRGFSEFSVIHLSVNSTAPMTILVNPFTGITEIMNEYKDFEWTYGRKKQS